jgi:hypothetical protein
LKSTADVLGSQKPIPRKIFKEDRIYRRAAARFLPPQTMDTAMSMTIVTTVSPNPTKIVEGKRVNT